MMMTAANEYVQAAEALGWNVTEDGGVLSFQQESPLGEDMVITAPTDKVAGALADYAFYFDPEEHASELVPMRGERGVPSSLRALLEDADKQAEMLDELVAAMKKAEEAVAERLAEEQAEAEAQRACPMPESGGKTAGKKRGRPKGRVNSRNKGKAGELEIAKELRKLGFKNARRGQQYSGTETSADVVGLQGIHPEIKRTEKLQLWPAMDQATADSGSSGDMPTVFHRKNRQPWVVVMKLEDWARLYAAWLREQETGTEQ